MDIVTNDSNDEIKKYLFQNEKTYEILIDFFDHLSNLSNETYQNMIEFISHNKNIFFKDHASGISFFHHIIRMACANFKYFEIFLDICVDFSSDFKQIDITENELIQISFIFKNSIYYLFTKNFFSMETIVEQSFLNNFLFINFLPEITEYDKEYAEIKTRNLLLSDQSNNEIKEDIKFLQFVIDNPDKHILYRSLNYNNSYIHELIRNDDINQFQNFVSHENVDYNYEIPFSYYERTKTNDRCVSLIKAAAIYGSIKIFKFLWKQPKTIIEPDLCCYAYCGRNYDIIHLCEEKECLPKDIFKNSIFLCSQELIDYSFDMYKNELIDNDKDNNIDFKYELYQNLNYSCLIFAVAWSNFQIIKANLKKILSIAKNEELINNIIYSKSSFLNASVHDLDLFKLIYSQKDKNVNKSNCGCYFDNLMYSLYENANDAFKFSFHYLNETINFIIFLQESIKCNHCIAKYILDRQIEEKKSNNLKNCIIFQNINKNIKFDDFKLAIEHYNESIVIKMIELYDPFKESDNIFNLVQLLEKNISKKMMISLFDHLFLLLPRNLLICFSALLYDCDCTPVADIIIKKLPRKI